MGVLHRNKVTVLGGGARTLIFSHGFGTDQTAWQPVASVFVNDFKVVLFDHVRRDPVGSIGLRARSLRVAARLCGGSTGNPRRFGRRTRLFVGHSVAGMIGMLAAIAAPERFSALVMLCPGRRRDIARI